MKHGLLRLLALVGIFFWANALADCVSSSSTYLSAWSGGVSALSGGAVAAVNGGLDTSSSCKLGVSLGSTSASQATVSDLSPNNEGHYRFRFLLNTAALGTLGGTESVVIFTATNAAPVNGQTALLAVSLIPITGGSSQLSLSYACNNGTTYQCSTNTGVALATGTNRIEFDMQMATLGANGYIRYWINAAVGPSEPPPTGSVVSISNAVFNGVKKATVGLNSPSSNFASIHQNQVVYFDGFASNRSDYMGFTAGDGTLPDLTITKTHSGSFTPGQIGATYTLTVTNVGSIGTTGMVTVTDILPSGSPAPLTVTGIQGNNWSCTGGAAPVCTTSNSLGSGVSYPVITVTVNVAANPPASIINTATVSGGGETNLGNNTATDPTAIVLPPDLTIAKVHNGTLSQGQIGATYTLTVKNVGGGPTTSSVTVTDILPSSLKATAMSGTNWTCTTGTTSSCTNSTQLAGGVTYPPITLTVNVDPSALSISNTATVSGGGDTTSANNSASDATSAQVVDNAALATVLANPQTFTGAWPGFSFGMAGDIPMVMRLNGSLIPVLYRPSTQFWYLNLAGFANGSAGTTRVVQFGLAGDSPQIVNLRGVDHVAVYRPSVGQVFLDMDNQTYSGGNMQILGAWQPLIPATVSQIVSSPNSFGGTWYSFYFGLSGDVPLLIQLTAGGPKLPVVYRPSVASWYINLGGYANYNANQLQVVAFGLPTDVPEVVYWNGGDHLAVYRPSTGQTLVDTNNQSYNGSNFVIIP